ncbi:ferritin-like catalase Nec2 [Malania oleifera]|uniref:ferritin-like catalase Nec2 n=1 Tax=Malania oleifera TaxID=397392 RepID=UPI0025AE364B|nr:ferritin-like catalase Nec2 [Malania oleifera]
MAAFSPTSPFATSLAFILFFLPLSSSPPPPLPLPLPLRSPRTPQTPPKPPGRPYLPPLPFPKIPDQDVAIVEFALNLEFAKAELFLYASTGFGLDRALQYSVTGFPRPLMNISAALFAHIMDAAFGDPFDPPFAAYANSINLFLTAYILPYLAANAYIDALGKLKSAISRALVAGLLASEISQDATIRTILYAFENTTVYPYKYTVAEFTNKISDWRNRLGNYGLKDEGVLVPRYQGAEGKSTGNLQSGDEYSLIYLRTPKEILRIVYTTGSENKPGGLFPYGAGGEIARRFLGGH